MARPLAWEAPGCGVIPSARRGRGAALAVWGHAAPHPPTVVAADLKVSLPASPARTLDQCSRPPGPARQAQQCGEARLTRRLRLGGRAREAAAARSCAAGCGGPAAGFGSHPPVCWVAAGRQGGQGLVPRPMAPAAPVIAHLWQRLRAPHIAQNCTSSLPAYLPRLPFRRRHNSKAPQPPSQPRPRGALLRPSCPPASPSAPTGSSSGAMEAPAALQPGLPDSEAPAFDDALYKSDAFRMSSMKVGGPAGAL